LAAKGVKHDSEKLQWDLVPWEELEEIVRVLTYGAEKYAPDNWKMVEPKERYFSALLRHVVAWRKGEKLDPETGISHLAHAGCNLLFLMYKDGR